MALCLELVVVDRRTLCGYWPLKTLYALAITRLHCALALSRALRFELSCGNVPALRNDGTSVVAVLGNITWCLIRTCLIVQPVFARTPYV